MTITFSEEGKQVVLFTIFTLRSIARTHFIASFLSLARKATGGVEFENFNTKTFYKLEIIYRKDTTCSESTVGNIISGNQFGSFDSFVWMADTSCK